MKALRFERLEQKQLLAGDVAVALSGATLEITGDNAANEIVVTRLAGSTEPFDWTLTGQNSTTINGSATPLEISVADLDAVMVDMGGGEDVFLIDGDSGEGVLLGGADLIIDVGQDGQNNMAGAEIVDLRSFTISNGNLTILGHAQNEFVSLTGIGLTVSDLTISTGSGTDSVYLETISGLGSQNIYIDTAQNGGVEDIELVGVTVYGRIDIFSGQGQDQVTLQHVYAAANGTAGSGVIALHGEQGNRDGLVLDDVFAQIAVEYDGFEEVV